MRSKNTSKDVYIEVNDIFDELSEENKRLNNELMFANNCLNILNKFKTFLNKICFIFESNINSEDKQELKQLEEEFNSVNESKIQLKETNVLIEENVREINGNVYENYDDLDYELSEEENESDSCSESSTFSNQSFKKTDKSNGSKRRKILNNKSKSKTKTKVNIKQEPNEVLNSLKFMQTNNTFDSTTQRYVCSYPSCDKSYVKQGSLNLHYRQTHDTNYKLFKCDFIGCEYECKSINRLKEHHIKHSDVRHFQCNICKNWFKTNQTMILHKNFVHTTAPGQFVCNYEECNQRFKRKIHLNFHIKRKHTFDKPFKCTECEKAFIRKCSLKDHQQIHSGNTFECEECHKVFNKESKLKSHKNIHFSNRETYSCDFCDSKTKSKYHLKKHIQLKHIIKEKTVKCDFEGCASIFKHISRMKAHKRQCHMSDDKLLVCDWPGCEQTFKSKTNCEDHKRSHLGKREFFCDFEGCGKAFLRKKTLGAHKDYHLKRFVCSWPECDQRFADKNLLKEHMNRHLNVKPFKCSFNGCPKEYFSRLSLRFHLTTVHKNQTNI